MSRDFRQAQLGPAVAAEYFRGGGKDPLAARLVDWLHHHSFTKFLQSVTLNR
jgi:hypothetical protein